jgi:hypothetical protein
MKRRVRIREKRGANPRADAHLSVGDEVPFSSNELRLSGRQWIIVVVIILVLFHLVPALWKRIERLEVGPDYRIPYSLGDDYWVYDRYCHVACSQNKTLVIGDSVMWGHYVSKEQTLSHYLNELAGEDHFANLSIDGIHPAAMAGLLKYYGRAISGKKVILHCNLLWMSSKKHDLQTEKEFSFNHPKLVPQFFPRIPCYAESFSGRIAIAIGRRVPFYGWVDHLRVAYFGDTSLPRWTIEHPYDDPIDAITLELPSSNELPSPRPLAEPWTNKRMVKFNPPWVNLKTSFQWSSFKRTIAILRHRGNRVFVLVGPFNEHMLREESLETYSEMKKEVEAWLQKEGIPHSIPSVLPSDYYADASHPLSDGYRILAKELLENDSFRGFDSF